MAVGEALALLAVAGAAGLAGGAHCAGMCGGIASAIAIGLRPPGPRMRVDSLVLAHAARLTGYALAGAAAAGLARSAAFAAPSALEPATRFALALALALLGVRILTGRDVLGLERLGARWFRALAPVWRRALTAPPGVRPLVLGLVWGFLPCGLVYSMLPVAAATGSPALAAAAMATFGLGTAPALVGVGWLGSRAGPRGMAARWRSVSGASMIACALWTAAGALAGHSHGHPAVPAARVAGIGR